MEFLGIQCFLFGQFGDVASQNAKDPPGRFSQFWLQAKYKTSCYISGYRLEPCIEIFGYYS